MAPERLGDVWKSILVVMQCYYKAANCFQHPCTTDKKQALGLFCQDKAATRVAAVGLLANALEPQKPAAHGSKRMIRFLFLRFKGTLVFVKGEFRMSKETLRPATERPRPHPPAPSTQSVNTEWLHYILTGVSVGLILAKGSYGTSPFRSRRTQLA